jgi:hypothetical protein
MTFSVPKPCFARTKGETMKSLKMLGLAVVAAMALTAFAAGTASATTLEVGGAAQNSAVSIKATLATGTSAILKDEAGTTTDTCTTSEVKGKTESPFSSASVSGPVETLSFKNCSHTTTVLKNGRLSVTWTSGTNGSVTSTEAEVTVQSTVFGASAICKTGAGTKLGTLTGNPTAEGKTLSTMDISATINCGILGNASWTGTYTVTSPEELGVTG